MIKSHYLAFSLITCALTACSLPFAPDLPPGMMLPSVKSSGIQPQFADVSYGSESSTQHLDLHLPKNNKPAPVVIFIHGGGFKFGDKRMISAALVTGFTHAGYAVASVNYRLSGEATFPAAVRDVFTASAYLKTHAADLGIDPKQASVYGESAGANLAALLGTAYDAPLFRADLPNKQTDLRPVAVIAQFPPVDFSQIDPMLKNQGCKTHEAHSATGSFESAYLGKALTAAPEQVRQANPAEYANKASAPLFIQNGDKDCNVGSGQSQLLVRALENAEAPVTYEQIIGAQHGGPQFETPENVQKLVEFLNKHNSASNR